MHTTPYTSQMGCEAFEITPVVPRSQIRGPVNVHPIDQAHLGRHPADERCRERWARVEG
jgi:hypothetical protein